jgi:hypothetical protein
VSIVYFLDYINMANELQLLSNPDNTPGAVSSGYQRQNTNFFASIVGLDFLNFSKDETANTLTLYAGGIVEINGALYKIPYNKTFNLDNTKNQYVSLLPNNPPDGYASAVLTDSPGTFDYTKNGYYSGGARIINPYDKLHGIIPYSIMGTIVIMAVSMLSTITYLAPPGWYGYSISGGKGGNGYTGGNGGQSGDGIRGKSGKTGKNGKTPMERKGIFRLDETTPLNALCGRDGVRGEAGSNGAVGSSSGGSYGDGGDGGSSGRGGNGTGSSLTGGNINLFAEAGEGGASGEGGRGGIGNRAMRDLDGEDGTDGADGEDGGNYLSLTASVAVWKIKMGE